MYTYDIFYKYIHTHMYFIKDTIIIIHVQQQQRPSNTKVYMYMHTCTNVT